MTREELEKKYLKDINGKTVFFMSGGYKDRESIFLWEPGGSQISVKPLDSSEEALKEIAKELKRIAPGRFSTRTALEYVHRREFCLSSHQVVGNEDVLERLAKLKQGDIYDFLSIVGFLHGHYPSCPY